MIPTPRGGGIIPPESDARGRLATYAQHMNRIDRRDALVAVVLTMLAEVELLISDTGRGLMSFVFAAGFLLAAGVSRRPLLVLVSVSLLLWADGLAGGVIASDITVALVAVAWIGFVAGTRTRLVPLLLAGVVGAGLLSIANQIESPGRFAIADDGVFYGVVVLGPVLAGWILGTRARQLTELRARNAELERRRETAVRLARVDEAARVERQIDVALAGRLRTIISAARHAGELDKESPESVPAQLAEVETTARAALTDLREVLGALGSGAAPFPGEPARAETTIRSSGRMPRFDLYDVLLVLAVVPLAIETSLQGHRGAGWLNVWAALVQGVLLVVVRRRPLSGTVVFLLVAGLQTALLTPLAPTVSWLLPGLLVPFLIGAGLRVRRSLAGLLLVLVGVAVMTVVTPSADRSLGGLLPSLVMGLLAWWAGRTVAVRDFRAFRLHELADHLARTRDDQARLAAADQRAEVARELHDVGAHVLTVVCLQAGAAQTMWSRDRSQARNALRVVLELADDSLVHLQDSLSGLAIQDTVAPFDIAALGVLAGLGRVLGLQVDVSVRGEPRPLSAEVARAAFRVVQEALTNVARHAARADVWIDLDYLADALEVQVSDSGPGPVDTSSEVVVNGAGLGLRGMRARVEACRGELTFGPLSGGGFSVRAVLPLSVTPVASLSLAVSR